MRFDIVTIFPELFTPFLEQGVLGRGVRQGRLKVRILNLRDFGEGVHRSVDDRPYGGGAGMVMMPHILDSALSSIAKEGSCQVVFLSPAGDLFSQSMARGLAKYSQLILVCGRYEGIDERVINLWADREISIGDYVLSGGELAALVVMDSVARLLPGILGDEASPLEESFSEGLLEYPHYTRPRVFRGMEVPPVLLGGNHQEIRNWRRAQALLRTKERRPDLFSRLELSKEDLLLLEKLKAQDQKVS